MIETKVSKSQFTLTICVKFGQSLTNTYRNLRAKGKRTKATNICEAPTLKTLHA